MSNGAEMEPPPPLQPPLPTAQPPFYNGWWEEESVEEPRPLETLSAGEIYAFAFDLSLQRYDAPGVVSPEMGEDFRAALQAADPRKTQFRAFARPVLLGDNLAYPGNQLQVEVWRGHAWERESTNEMIPFDIDLKLLRSGSATEVHADERFAAESAPLRLAGIRFSVKALKPGCGAIALSIWSREKTIPLDHVILPVAVGGAACETRPSEGASGLASLLFERPEANFDGALHIFDFSLPGGGQDRSVALYVPRHPTKECPDFYWQTPVPAGTLFNQPRMQIAFSDLRATKKYGTFAGRIKENLFPNDKARCGANAALAQMAAQAGGARPSLFVRLVNVDNEAVFVPLGSLFLIRDIEGERIFRHPPRLSFPLPRERYGPASGCIADVTLAVPPTLAEKPTFEPPEGYENEPTEEMLSAFMARPEEPSPSPPPSPRLFVLLGHQGDGAVYFTQPTKPWDVSTADREFGRGSVALLAVCSAGDLSGREMRLVRALNHMGFDAIAMSSFEMPDTVGIALAEHFTRLVFEARRAGAAKSVGELFEAARAEAQAELARSEGDELAEGYFSEIFLAGDSSLRLCGKDEPHAH